MPKDIIRVQSVIFDMDGVITNTMPDHFRAWKQVLHDEGLKVTHLDIYSREGQQGLQSVREICEKYQYPFTMAKAKRLLNKKEILFKRSIKTRFISGSRSLLRKLDRNGIRLALVTGTSRHELMKMLPDHIRGHFEVIVTGSDVVNGKPHPEPFLKCIKKMAIKPEDAVVIENAPLGIASAKAANLSCFAVATSLDRTYLTQADRIFDSVRILDEKVEFRTQDEI